MHAESILSCVEGRNGSQRLCRQIQLSGERLVSFLTSCCSTLQGQVVHSNQIRPTLLVQGDGTIMGGIVVMRPVTNEVEYIYPETEFGTYPDVQEVCCIKRLSASSTLGHLYESC